MSRSSKSTLFINLLRYGLELLELINKRNPQHTKILIDTSVILSSIMISEKDQRRILLLNNLIQKLAKLKIKVLVPSLILLELWSVLSSKMQSPRDQLPKTISDIIHEFKKLPNILIKLDKRSEPLVETEIEIEWIPTTVEDFENMDSNGINNFGLFDELILTMAKRIGAYLLTMEKNFGFLDYAIFKKNVKIMTPCSLNAAEYYKKEYVSSQNIDDIINYVSGKERRIKIPLDLFDQLDKCFSQI